MRRNLTRAAISICACALASCSLFVSLDDLSNGSADASTSDASSDAGASDVVQSDVVVPDGAAGDGAVICTGFCDNFDDRTTPVGAWDAVNQFGDGDPVNMTISTDQFLSAPQSLHVHMPAKSAGAAGAVFLTKDFPITAAKISIDFDIKILGSSTSLDGYSNLMETQIDGDYAGSFTTNGNGHCTADYWVQFPDGGHIQPSFDVGLLDSGWHHVHYAVLYDQTSGSFVMMWDSASIADVSPTITVAVTAPSVVSMWLGYTAQPQMPTLDIYYDNVQVQ